MARRRAKRRLRGALIIIALALLIAGFMIRRLMTVGAMRRDSQDSSSYAHNPNPEGEHISNADRERLNRVLRDKSGGGR